MLNPAPETKKSRFDVSRRLERDRKQFEMVQQDQDPAPSLLFQWLIIQMWLCDHARATSHHIRLTTSFGAALKANLASTLYA